MSREITSATNREAVRTIDVQGFINSHGVSGHQILIIVVCFLIVSLDGFDAQGIPYIAPAIKDQLHLSPAQLSPLFGLTQVGVLIGAFLFGPLADKFGRKRIIAVAVACFGIFSLASAYVGTIDVLAWLRFLTGLGLGGAIPNAITLTSEYCPQKKRALLVTLMFTGYNLGGAVGGIIAAQMVLAWGWHSVFWYGGLVPIILVPVAWFCLPESVRYLVLTSGDSKKITRALQRIAPESDLSQAKFVFNEPKLTGFPAKRLFGKGLRSGTICLWITFCANLMALYFIVSWLPTIVHSVGGSLTKASLLTSTYGTGVVFGSIFIGYLMDRRNQYYVLAAALLLGGIAFVTIGHAIAMPLLLVIALLIAGLGTAGAQTGLMALSAGFYPTASRATGVGWAIGIGRFGAIVGAMIGGFMLAAHWGLPKVFLVVSIPLLVAAVSMLFMHHFQSAPAPAASPELQTAATPAME